MERISNLLDEALGILDLDNNSFSSSTDSLPSASSSGTCVLIQDCVETSAAFVIHHILKRSLSPHPQSSSAVIFVSLAHPFSHYHRILRKLLSSDEGSSTKGGQLPMESWRSLQSTLGCNLAAHQDDGRFFFVDMLMLGCTDHGKGISHSGELIHLYGKIQKFVEDIALNGGNKKRITIILDDFSLIEVAASGSFSHSLDFLQYCYTLTSENGCSLVILNHEDNYFEEESSTPMLQMEYLANIIIKAEPLATGLAADVHGQLTVLNKGIHDKSRNSLNKVRNFHYKLKENGVECFYPGTRA